MARCNCKHGGHVGAVEDCWKHGPEGLLRNRWQQAESRIRRGLQKVKKCFRCLGKHIDNERYCPLAAEYMGDPRKESDFQYFMVHHSASSHRGRAGAL